MATEQDQPLLHDYWRSSASYRVRIALALKGIEHRTNPIDLLAQAHREPGHLARNPQGLVPVLEIDGLVLTQSLAIVEYLDETRPDPPLLPFNPAARARVRALAYAIAMEIHPICNPSVAMHVEQVAGGDETMRVEWMRHFIARGFAAFEKLLDHPQTGTFCHRDAPGLADVCLVPQLYNARRWDVPLDAFPRLTAIADACAELPAFQAAHPDRARPDE